jgi:hypothetical protein
LKVDRKTTPEAKMFEFIAQQSQGYAARIIARIRRTVKH